MIPRVLYPGSAFALALFCASFTTAAGQGSPSGSPAAPTAGSAAPASSHAGARRVEDIAAVIGSRTILKSEVDEQVRAAAEQLQLDLADTSVANPLRREVLNRMVNDQVLYLEAEAQNIKVPDDELNQTVDDEIKNNVQQMGQDGFRAELKKEGLTEAELRARYLEEARKQMMVARLIQKEVRPKVALPDSVATRKFYEENRAQLPKKPRQIRIQDLFIATRPDSVIERRALERAQDVRKKILAGLSFDEAAKTYSDDPRAKESASLGRVQPGQLPFREVEAAAFALAVGEVSQPIHSRMGYHLLKVDAKGPNGEWIELSHILFAANSTRADENAALERARSVYEQIRSGKLDFGEAVRKFSDDPQAKDRNGDLGWIPADNVYGEMKAVADTLRVGRLSAPVAGDGGYHIFKILGEQAEGEYAFDEISDQLKQLAARNDMEKELQAYVDQLRKKFFVDIRAAK